MANTGLTTKEKKLLYLILASGFFIKLILAFTVNTPLKSDSVTYHKLALSILSGQYEIDGRTTAFVVCGYPAFLSAIYYVFGEGQFWIKLIQSLLEIFSGLLFFKISLKFFDVRNSLLSLCIFTFLPSNILFSQTILTEPLFGFLYLLVILLTLKDDIFKGIFLTGVAFGFAIMVRSSFSFAVLLIPLYLFIERKNLFEKNVFGNVAKYSVIFFAGVFIILSGWIIRNKVVMNSFTLATQGGSTLWEGNNPQANGTWNPEAVNSNPLFENPDEVYREKEFYRQAREFILNNPVKFLTLGVKKLGYLFSSERMIVLYFTDSSPGETSTEVYRSVSVWILLLVNIPYFVIMIMGTWGLIMLDRHRFFVFGFIAMWLVTIFIFVGLARYHYVLIPFFVLGTVNFFIHRKTYAGQLSLIKKTVAIAFTIFLISVWVSEVYLMITK